MAPGSGLTAPAVTPANDVWAVGYYDGLILIEHWDGMTWRIVPGPGFGRLYGVAAAAVNDVWAVGSQAGNSLIERYTGLCATATATSPAPTRTSTPTPVSPPTHSPSPLATQTPTVATVTPCALRFSDVGQNNAFYSYIRCLACRGIVGGYPCGSPGEPCPGLYFRPNNNVTRGQVAKIVSEAAGFADPVPSTQQTFADVAPGSTFWGWIERLAGRGIIQGYPCGGPFEPCLPPTNRPYFRQNNNVTRGQLSKIVSGAAGYTETPTTQTFEDVLVGSTFYVYVERIAGRGIVSGYPCGGPGEPCQPPGNQPYFRPNNPATRGQMSKIAAETFLPGCAAPLQR